MRSQDHKNDYDKKVKVAVDTIIFRFKDAKKNRRK